MRIELKQIQEETGITFIFVTHDQEEALTMSDRIAVMSAGRIQQVGAAREIYEEPRNRFVADCIGETNLLDVTVAEMRNGIADCELAGRPAPAGEAHRPGGAGRQGLGLDTPRASSAGCSHPRGSPSPSFSSCRSP